MTENLDALLSALRFRFRDSRKSCVAMDVLHEMSIYKDFHQHYLKWKGHILSSLMFGHGQCNVQLSNN